MFLTKLRLVTAVLLLGSFVFAGVAISSHVLKAGQNGMKQADISKHPELENDKPRTDRPDDATEENSTKPLSTDSKVRTLLKERLDAFRGIEAETEKTFQRALAPLDTLLQAKLSVLKAELDLSESDQERIAVHERIVALAKQLEQAVFERFQAGRILLSDLLRAKVSRLEAEIDLERAREKAAAKRK